MRPLSLLNCGYISSDGRTSVKLSSRLQKVRLGFSYSSYMWRRHAIRLSIKGGVIIGTMVSILLCFRNMDVQYRCARTFSV